MPCIDFVAITTAYNWEPYLALMPVTATEGDLAAGDTSVGFGPSAADVAAAMLITSRQCRKRWAISERHVTRSCGRTPLHIPRQVVSLLHADKYRRPVWRPPQRQNGADSR